MNDLRYESKVLVQRSAIDSMWYVTKKCGEIESRTYGFATWAMAFREALDWVYVSNGHRPQA